MTRLKGGVHGNVKNLIFAANGFKPEIVLIDSVSNDIQIVKNEEYCLVYDKPILERELLWTDLIDWWAEQPQMASLTRKEQEQQLYQRLLISLHSCFGRTIDSSDTSLVMLFLHLSRKSTYTMIQKLLASFPKGDGLLGSAWIS